VAASFVDCHADLLPSLRRFLARVYRPDYILCNNEALFRWQFGEVTSGNGTVYRLKLAQVEDEIVGCLGYIPVDVSLGGQLVRGAWMVNWMVDPLQRRLGLGPLLMREVTSQFDVALNVGPNRDARDLLGRMGWTDFGELARYVCVLDIRAAGALTRTGKLQWPLIAPRPGEGKLPPGTNIKLVSRFCDEATQLWDEVWGQQAAGTRRSTEFLNRRYADHPSFNYRLFELHQRGRLSGMAVYRVEQVQDMPVRLGRIVEFISKADGEEYLLRALLDDARAQEIAAVDFFCSSRRFSRLMARQGFLRGEDAAASQLPTLFQPIDWRRQGISFVAYLRNLPKTIAVRDWYVTKGDGDQDRPN
jgi:hypothetical protein